MKDDNDGSIKVKGPHFNASKVQFRMGLRVNFGTTQCQDQMEIIKRIGFEPANNCIVIIHEFATADGPSKAIAKYEEMKKAGMLDTTFPLLKGLKKERSILLGCISLPASMAEPLSILKKLSAFLGPEFAAKDQRLEFNIAASKELKDILHDPAASVLASALEALCIKLQFTMRHDLPIKVAEFLAALGPPPAQSQIKLMGQCIAAAQHFKLKVQLQEQSAELKDKHNDYMTVMLGSIANMVMGLVQQFGLLDIVKMCGKTSEVTLCLSPLLAFDLRLFVPSGLEALSKFAPMPMST